jgi:hypothetical protein
LNDEDGWMVFDISLVVETHLSYIPAHLQRDITQIIQSPKAEVAILAHRKSGPVLFQEILSSRWWYQ